jgi:hypothetical protein
MYNNGNWPPVWRLTKLQKVSTILSDGSAVLNKQLVVLNTSSPTAQVRAATPSLRAVQTHSKCKLQTPTWLGS